RSRQAKRRNISRSTRRDIRQRTSRPRRRQSHRSDRKVSGKTAEVSGRRQVLCRIGLQKLRLKLEPVVGFEPTTDGLQNRCSTTELNWLSFFQSITSAGSLRGLPSVCILHL